MVRYEGKRFPAGTEVYRYREKDRVLLPLRLDLSNHSPDGFEWGNNTCLQIKTDASCAEFLKESQDTIANQSNSRVTDFVSTAKSFLKIPSMKGGKSDAHNATKKSGELKSERSGMNLKNPLEVNAVDADIKNVKLHCISTIEKDEKIGTKTGEVQILKKSESIQNDLNCCAPTATSKNIMVSNGGLQLSLAIVSDFLNDDDLAFRIYHEFNWDYVSRIHDQEWVLTEDQLRGAIEKIVKKHTPRYAL